ncbi:hypothetical protein EVAR_5887_1 [Eumeta japonica]|uniref:Uncharacterized protein n=1 Tax=Eumeta variegata TaxID=151549 RepID=A0A4C1TBZ6_EUMVA|nr:hypothetical protein EVAR_5887_1 [Eumeta japonica]
MHTPLLIDYFAKCLTVRRRPSDISAVGVRVAGDGNSDKRFRCEKRDKSRPALSTIPRDVCAAVCRPRTYARAGKCPGRRHVQVNVPSSGRSGARAQFKTSTSFARGVTPLRYTFSLRTILLS